MSIPHLRFAIPLWTWVLVGGMVGGPWECASGCLGQESLPATGEAPKQLSDHPVETTERRLIKRIEAMRQQWGVPGMAVAVVQGDQVLFSQGFGVRQTGQPEAVDSQTLFAIASNSKAFTSAALAMLVDEGKLQWDDPVSDFLPWLELRDPMTRDLRVRDLLCHRSGLGTFSGDLLWWGTSYSPREVLERARELEPASEFRAEFGYSNLMYLAAGLVIEEVSGQSWNQFVTSRILQPLGMGRTILSTDDLPQRGNYATPHKSLVDGNLPLEWMNWDSMVAAGGVISCADDMSRWLRLQLRQGTLPASLETAPAVGDSLQLFSEQQSRIMWQPHTPQSISEAYRSKFPSTQFRAYGLGWSLWDYQGRKVVGHGGGYDGMYSRVMLVPSEQLGVVVLTNSMTGISTAISYTVLDELLGVESRDWSSRMLGEYRGSRRAFERRIQRVITPVAEGTQPSRELSAYAGRYRCAMYGDATVEVEDNRLVLRLLPNPQLVADLEHLHYDTFVIHWREELAWFGSGTANFTMNARGEFAAIELDVPNDDMWFYELDLRRVPKRE